MSKFNRNESETLEFKETYTDTICKEIVSFLNANGGDIVLGVDNDGNPVMLSDIWPSDEEIAEAVAASVLPEMYAERYNDVYTSNSRWNTETTTSSELYAWNSDSTYIQEPPFLTEMTKEPAPLSPIVGARALLVLGDSVTTDHISPAGAFKASSPAGKYLSERGIEPKDFNSYGSRRGNHEVMVRGTFGNIRLRNRIFDSVGLEVQPGGFTYDFLKKQPSTIFEAGEN